MLKAWKGQTLYSSRLSNQTTGIYIGQVSFRLYNLRSRYGCEKIMWIFTINWADYKGLVIYSYQDKFIYHIYNARGMIVNNKPTSQ